MIPSEPSTPSSPDLEPWEAEIARALDPTGGRAEERDIEQALAALKKSDVYAEACHESRLLAHSDVPAVGVRTQRGYNGVVVGQKSVRSVLFGSVAVIAITVGVFLGLSKSSTPTIATQSYRTASGQQSTVRLADGSTIHLAPATSVDVATDGITVRGEAYFNIVTHSARVFTVHTDNAVAEVLGTRFVVRKYADERDTRVVVEDGKVAVRTNRNIGGSTHRTVITRQMLAQVTDSGVSTTSGIATREYTSWRQGMLVFNAIPLGEVVTELGRAYGADIRVPDSALANKAIIAEVEVARMPLAQVLDFVTTILDAHYIRDGGRYVLSPGKNTKAVPREQPRKQFPQPEKQYGR